MDINYYSSDSSDEEVVYTSDDYLNNPHTKHILETRFFETFKENMSDKLEKVYCDEVDFVYQNYMDVFHYEFDKEKFYDLFLQIYPFISKKYDYTIFENEPQLNDYLIKVEEQEEETQKKAPTVITSKKYDWDEKKYK